jgi:rubrerythrin
MTADFLRSSYGGESMAHMRYLIWGDMADKEGMPNIARLFRAIAYAEWAHARNHFDVLKEQAGDFTVPTGAVFGLKKTADNLQGAIDGELHEVEQMYPAFMAVAQLQDEKGAQRSFHYALEAEKIHAKIFKQAQDAAKQGKDMELGPVYICSVCGHTIADHLPDKCPVCGAKQEKYKHFA